MSLCSSMLTKLEGSADTLLFCGKKCGFWEWAKEGETSGESSVVGNPSNNHVATVLDNNVSCMFETMCRLTHDKDVEITVTIRKGNANAASDDKKGKGPA